MTQRYRGNRECLVDADRSRRLTHLHSLRMSVLLVRIRVVLAQRMFPSQKLSHGEQPKFGGSDWKHGPAEAELDG